MTTMPVRQTSKAEDGCKKSGPKNAHGPMRGHVCHTQIRILTAQTANNLPSLLDQIAATFGHDLFQQLAGLSMVAHFFLGLGQGQLSTYFLVGLTTLE